MIKSQYITRFYQLDLRMKKQMGGIELVDH